MTRRSFSLAIGFNRALRGAMLAAAAATALACHAGAASAQAELLDRAGQRVKQFWDELSSVTCTESLLQEKLNQKGKVAFNSRSTYDYLISLRWDPSGMLVDESRLPTGQPQKKAPQSSLLVTQGFATLLMIFHPEFQPGYSFNVEGSESAGGRTLARVSFVPRNGAKSPAALSLKDRSYPIAWEGTAWIDSERAIVTRIQTHWKDPAKEIPIQSLSSEVQYAPISFRGGAQTMWLPERARIEVKTLHQEWRNTHQFSNYRLFSVDAQNKIGEARPSEPKQ